MILWLLLSIVFAAGLIGGAVNALLTDNGFFLPKFEKVGVRNIWQPGYIGNAVIGGVAACISWGLYGPFAATFLLGGITPEAEEPGLSLSAFVGAILIGMGGAKWLTNEIDKRVLQAAASSAAALPANPARSSQIAVASPMEALRLSQD